MGALQEAFEEALAGAPYQLAADVVSEKLAARGVELTTDEREEVIRHLESGEDGVFSLERSGPGGGDSLSVEITEEDAQGFHDRFDVFLSTKLPDLVDSIAATLSVDVLRTLHESWREESNLQKRERCDFEGRLHKRWGKAIDRLRMLLTVAREFGETENRILRDNPRSATPRMVDVLTRLHGRACQVTHEIVCLLSAGYSDGAMARWRTLHEIAVVALFVEKHGEDVASRYIDHDVIESSRALLDYDECCERLGYEPLTDLELEETRRAREKAVLKYGPAFDTQYGWAADALGAKKPSIWAIERASGIDHLRAHYRLASHNVHANPKGVFFKLGLLDEADTILTGPSDVGLADPGHCSAISLMQTTTALGQIGPTLDSIVSLRILGRLVDEVGEAFHEAGQGLQENAG